LRGVDGDVARSEGLPIKARRAGGSRTRGVVRDAWIDPDGPAVSVSTVRVPEMTTADDQTKLYQQHRSWLIRAANARFRDHDLAEDLVQETFVKIFRNWANRDSKSLTRQYLSATLRNCFLDQIRHREVRVAELLTDPMDLHATVEGESAGGQLDFTDEMQAAICGLPPQQREIVYHHYFEGFPLREVAEIMGLAPRTVHNYHLLAKKRIAAHLSQYAAESEGRRDER
jgi:RNA polymerase sigma-70 factor (ECF subfamily)